MKKIYSFQFDKVLEDVALWKQGSQGLRIYIDPSHHLVKLYYSTNCYITTNGEAEMPGYL